MAPWAPFTRLTVSIALATLRSQPTTRAPSDANSQEETRPMLPPLPVMMQTFPESRPAMTVLLLRSLGGLKHLAVIDEYLVDAHAIAAKLHQIARRVGESPAVTILIVRDGFNRPYVTAVVHTHDRVSHLFYGLKQGRKCFR